MDRGVMAAFRLLGIALSEQGAARRDVVMTASVRAADGNSFVAGGLASALAELGRRVLLVDANLQNPIQHRTFHIPAEPGLVQLLDRNGPELGASVVHVSASGVAVMPAGTKGAFPERLSPFTMQQLAKVLHALDYPMVIIDAPPILERVEAMLLAQIAGTRLLTVRSGATRRRDVTDALAILTRHGRPATGVILNDHVDLFARRHADRCARPEPSRADVKSRAPATGTFGLESPVDAKRLLKLT